MRFLIKVISKIVKIVDKCKVPLYCTVVVENIGCRVLKFHETYFFGIFHFDVKLKIKF